MAKKYLPTRLDEISYYAGFLEQATPVSSNTNEHNLGTKKRILINNGYDQLKVLGGRAPTEKCSQAIIHEAWLKIIKTARIRLETIREESQAELDEFNAKVTEIRRNTTLEQFLRALQG